MITLAWILTGLVAFVFVMSGSMKLMQSREKVIASGGKWAEDFAPNTIKIIGVIEVLIGLAVIVPKLLHHGYYITSAAASVMVIIMAGAFYTHLRRKENAFLLVTAIILLMALYVGYWWCPAMGH